MKKYGTRSYADSNQLIPYVREIAFFNNQNVLLKDYLDVAELFTYEFCKKDEVLFDVGDSKSSMYIVIDGKVECSVNMKEQKVTEEQI